jgi:hypothetical protein
MKTFSAFLRWENMIPRLLFKVLYKSPFCYSMIDKVMCVYVCRLFNCLAQNLRSQPYSGQ